jgi:hypothetical protein
VDDPDELLRGARTASLQDSFSEPCIHIEGEGPECHWGERALARLGHKIKEQAIKLVIRGRKVKLGEYERAVS